MQFTPIVSLNQTSPLGDQLQSVQTVPIINMQSQNSSNGLINAFMNSGFAIITNHGISNETIDTAFQLSNRYFSSSQKEQIPYDEQTFVGYVKRSERRDFLEFSYLENQSQKPYIPKIENFKEFYEVFYKDLFNLSLSILEAIEKQMNLQSKSLTQFTDDINRTKFRLLHYSEVDLQNIYKDGLIRAHPHTDYGFLTLLLQHPGQGQNGLRVLSKNRKWMKVSPPDYSIIINIADVLQLVNNDILKSTIHSVRVDDEILKKLQEKSIEKSPERFSIGMFLNPKQGISLKPLQCLGNAKYQPINSQQFINGRNLSAKKQYGNNLIQ